MPARRKETKQITARFGGDGPAMAIGDPEAFKVLYEPVRFQIVRLLDEPMSAKEIADAVGRPLTSLYYHLNLLSEHGLITVVEDRISGRTVERVFRRSADAFSATGDVAEVVDGLALGETSPLGSAVRHIRRTMTTQPERSTVRISIDSKMHITAEQAKELAQRLRSTVNEFADTTGTDDTRAFRVLIAIADDHEEDRS